MVFHEYRPISVCAAHQCGFGYRQHGSFSLESEIHLGELAGVQAVFRVIDQQAHGTGTGDGVNGVRLLSDLGVYTDIPSHHFRSCSRAQRQGEIGGQVGLHPELLFIGQRNQGRARLDALPLLEIIAEHRAVNLGMQDILP